MVWQEYIYSNPQTLHGKSTLKGTRLSVELIFELMSDGLTENAF